ncbi:LuxR C-terminal-related transcriptional regulator [Sphingomonas kyeonggiensis]|uniref:FixJ family two-component response regulator n=1 Tax=Sphingomonas kyeonggiensis TaxID=1268553 RepID=A0A7W6NWT4_9SPHN|nr:FixJ family two-component response regulator [Sphingomonas kyeonggiensis]
MISKQRCRWLGDESAAVLIVDDDAELQADLICLFASAGITATGFSSAAEILGATLPYLPSCLILDLHLGRACGLATQQRLLEKGFRSPVIFLTGSPELAAVVDAMKAGASDFLAKPFDPSNLIRVVRSALERDRERWLADERMRDLRQRAGKLTPRELDVFQCLMRGLLNKQIAFELGLSEITVKIHRSNVKRKLRAESVVDLVRKGFLLEV